MSDFYPLNLANKFYNYLPSAYDFVPKKFEKVRSTAILFFEEKFKETYHVVESLIYRVFTKLSDLLNNFISKPNRESGKEVFIYTAEQVKEVWKQVQKIQPNDPIPPVISQTAIKCHKLVRLFDTFYIASQMLTFPGSLGQAIKISDALQGQSTSLLSQLASEDLEIRDGFKFETTHPMTDNFILKCGISGTAFFTIKTVSLITGSDVPITVINTIAIVAGSSPQFKNMFYQTTIGKNIQSIAHNISDNIFVYSTLPVRSIISVSIKVSNAALRTQLIQNILELILGDALDGFKTLLQSFNHPYDKQPDFLSWFWSDKFFSPIGEKIKEAQRDMLDKVSKNIVLTSIKFYQIVVFQQLISQFTAKMSTRNTVFTSLTFITGGGKDQTIQSFAIRTLAAVVFYRTSSSLTGPLMSTVLLTKKIYNWFEEHRKYLKQEMIEDMQKKNRNQREIESALKQAGLDRSPWEKLMDSTEKKVCAFVVPLTPLQSKLIQYWHKHSSIPQNPREMCRIKKTTTLKPMEPQQIKNIFEIKKKTSSELTTRSLSSKELIEEFIEKPNPDKSKEIDKTPIKTDFLKYCTKHTSQPKKSFLELVKNELELL